ncbi:sensor histidine kinase [Edaphobacter bradus]|uniref:sensor histidine kinase n=1 Tax=Edaphobacter bradus TaxID=2259016 RepID=UPI0021E04B64|nr:two-component regulator propeller domain-containing protein [Edaphobacter bradus]
MNPTRLHRALRSALLTLLCSIAPCMETHGQGTGPLGHQSWTTENGLPQNSVHQIFQTQDGYIWIATEGGAARFNGIDFKIFHHDDTPAFASDDVCCFAQARQPGSPLWIGTSDGLLQYSAGSFRRYTTSEGLPSNDFLSLATADDGSLYLLTSNGLAHFNGKNFTTISAPGSASALVTSESGNPWLVTSSGPFELQPNRALPHALPLPLPAEPLQGAGTLPNHGAWLRTSTTITLLSDGHARTLTAGRDLPGTRIESFFADSRGLFWIGTNRGLFMLSNTAGQPILEPSLSANSILSLFEDREGNLWAGTETAGLFILRQQSFVTIPALSDQVITSITQCGDGALWAGTNGDGLDRWQNNAVQHLSTKNGLLSEIVLALAPGTQNSLWVGTPDGLNRIQGGHVEAFTSADGLPDDLIRSLLLDSDGTLWIGTRRGLAHWHDNIFTTYTHANGLGSDLVGALVQPHSSRDLWISTLDGLSLLHNGAITTYTTRDGLSGNVITSLYEDPQGALWIGTKGNGLSVRIKGHITSLQRADLPQTIDSILGDGSNLWLSSSRGIARVPQSQLIACAVSGSCDLHANIYGRSDGMPTEETTSIGHPAAWRTADGRLWFATRKGVAIADPLHLQENRIPPPVVIERFTVDDAELPVAQPIPYGHSRFVFQYAGLSYTAPSRIRYRYILEGFDKQWTEAGTRRTAYYTSLPAGHYTFRVQAANNAGVWNETGAALSLSVRPPFYRTLWFILLAVTALIALGILLYRLHLRRLRSQFAAVLAERNRMAREIHDTLAQSFAGVSVQLELISQLLAQSHPSAASQQLDRTRAYVREGLAEARRSIWNLRAVTAQNTLPTRLTHLVEQSRAEPLAIQLNIGGTYRPLPPAVEDEVLRIAQEALINIQRHANATQAAIDLRYDTTRLHLSIADNGRGFSPATVHNNGHFGLQGMRERAAQINAQCNIASSPGHGATVSLDVPISPEKGSRKNA